MSAVIELTDEHVETLKKISTHGSCASPTIYCSECPMEDMCGTIPDERSAAEALLKLSGEE